MPRKRITETTDSSNPLGMLITARMDELGLSSYDVERRGGPPARTVQFLARPDRRFRQPPWPATLEKLAHALELPLAEVRRVAAEGAQLVSADADDASVRQVVALMQDLPEERRRGLVKLVRVVVTLWDS